MFVDHLAYAVFEQHYKLIEGLDLALQLDSVDQINGHWNPLLAQMIQKRFLQGLAFCHGSESPCFSGSTEEPMQPHNRRQRETKSSIPLAPNPK
jgi:hypothetical protein